VAFFKDLLLAIFVIFLPLFKNDFRKYTFMHITFDLLHQNQSMIYQSLS